jgi:glycosyltransferase involved in cell wall biosynthesis
MRDGPSRRWITAQIGAREHYAAARAMALRGRLRLHFTDLWATQPAARLAAWLGPAARPAAVRRHEDVPDERVAQLPLWTTLARVRHQLVPNRSSIERGARKDVEVGRAFARGVRIALSKLWLDPERDVYFGFNTGCLETLSLLKERGVLSIVDQIDPARVEEQMVFEESLRWPGWQALPGRIPEFYWQRIDQEWALADRVLVNSDWSKRALIEQGVPAGKIEVVPLAYEPPADVPHIDRPRTAGRPLVVLFLGTVMLRKGIQYLIEAARLLAGENVEFIVAGPLYISDNAVRSAPPSMRFAGRVTRDQVSEFYRRADVFVLPTISDGFAITQLEAMAHGLPVIATPNCGEVVTPESDGLIVPPRDPAALAQAIVRFCHDRTLAPQMGERAIEKSKQFSLAAYGDALERLAASARS